MAAAAGVFEAISGRRPVPVRRSRFGPRGGTRAGKLAPKATAQGRAQPLPRAITILGAPVEAGRAWPARRWARPFCALRALSDASGPRPRGRGPGRPRASASSGSSDARPKAKRMSSPMSRLGPRLLAARDLRSPARRAAPITLGGDHSLAMGSIGGVARYAAETGRELFVLWLDAHSDFNTPLTSPSGNMHGMAVAMLCQEPGLEGVFGTSRRVCRSRAGCTSSASGPSTRANGDCCRPRHRRCRHAAAGRRRLRPLDPPHHRPDARPPMASCMSVWTSTFSIRPSRRASARPFRAGRPTARRILSWSCLYDSGLSPSLDLVELNPFLDDRGKSALLLVDLAASLFGRQVYSRMPAGASRPAQVLAEQRSRRSAIRLRNR